MKTITKFFLISLSLILISCNSYKGIYDEVNSRGVLNIYSDGTCSFDDRNLDIWGTWKKVEGGIQIDDFKGVYSLYNGYWEAWDTSSGKGLIDIAGYKWQKRDNAPQIFFTAFFLILSIILFYFGFLFIRMALKKRIKNLK